MEDLKEIQRIYRRDAAITALRGKCICLPMTKDDFEKTAFIGNCCIIPGAEFRHRMDEPSGWYIDGWRLIFEKKEEELRSEEIAQV